MHRVVVKIGSSSVTSTDGAVNTEIVDRLCDEIVALANRDGWSSSSPQVRSQPDGRRWEVARGLPTLPPSRRFRPSDSIASCAYMTMRSDQGD